MTWWLCFWFIHSSFSFALQGIGEEMLIQEVGGGTDWGEIILNLGEVWSSYVLLLPTPSLGQWATSPQSFV